MTNFKERKLKELKNLSVTFNCDDNDFTIPLHINKKKQEVLEQFLSNTIDEAEKEERNRVIDKAQIIINEEFANLIGQNIGKKQEIINLITKL